MSLELHIKISNYIPRMSRQATETTMDIVDPRDHNWNDDLSLQRPKMVLQDSEDEVSDASFDADIKDLTEEYLMNMLVNSNFKDVQKLA